MEESTVCKTYNAKLKLSSTRHPKELVSLVLLVSCVSLSQAFASPPKHIRSGLDPGAAFDRRSSEGFSGLQSEEDSSWHGAEWSEFGNGNSPPRPVWDMALNRADLVIALWPPFWPAFGGEPLGRVDLWNGNHWETLVGGDPGGMVYALGDYRGQLVAAGSFEEVGDTSVSHIAAWGRDGWLPLGAGVDFNIIAFGSYRGNLVAGGFWPIYGPQDESIVARWNGRSWSPLTPMPGDPDGWLLAIVEYRDRLIAGGLFFPRDRSMDEYYLAQWDGRKWELLQRQMNEQVFALAVYKGELIAGGMFTQAGDVEVNHIARWDGQDWWPLGEGTDDDVNALGVYKGELIAGGRFATAGDVDAQNIARWNGEEWRPMGDGVDDDVLCLIEDRGDLLVGGRFHVAGGKASPYLARWGPAERSVHREEGNSYLPTRVGRSAP